MQFCKNIEYFKIQFVKMFDLFEWNQYDFWNQRIEISLSQL